MTLSDQIVDLSVNPMDWADVGAPSADRSEDNINVVGAAARLAVFNHVRCAFDVDQQRGKVSRRQIAEALGVSSSLVGRWLRSPANITIETAAKLLFAMGREFRLASPQLERADGIVRNVVWNQIAPTASAPKFNLTINSEAATVRCPLAAGDLELSVFDGEEGVEAWITGPGFEGTYLKAKPQDEPVARLPVFGTAGRKRDLHVHHA